VGNHLSGLQNFYIVVVTLVLVVYLKYPPFVVRTAALGHQVNILGRPLVQLWYTWIQWMEKVGTLSWVGNQQTKQQENKETANSYVTREVAYACKYTSGRPRQIMPA